MGSGFHFAKKSVGLSVLLLSTSVLADVVLRKPMPGDEDVFLIVNKQSNELVVHSFSDPELVIKKYRAISGANAGDKVSEGDRKTPEGIYFLEREVGKSRLRPMHGSAAFELNYPNPYDRINHRTGHGIWLHGVDKDSRMEKRFDTQGCVALANGDVIDLRQWLGADRMTPVLIVDQVVAGQPLGIENVNSALGQRITDWVNAWSSKDADAYLSFYDPHFYARKMNFSQWTKYKRRLARNYQSIKVTIEDLKIFRHGKYSVALFHQRYVSNRYTSYGWKRLYLLGDGKDARILAEEMRNEVDSLMDESLAKPTSIRTITSASAAPTPPAAEGGKSPASEKASH